MDECELGEFLLKAKVNRATFYLLRQREGPGKNLTSPEFTPRFSNMRVNIVKTVRYVMTWERRCTFYDENPSRKEEA